MLLFGGNKGYNWMVTFLGLLNTIKLKPRVVQTEELIMTQYMLKMLTILTNILVSNLITLQMRAPRGENLDATGYISKLVSSLTQRSCKDIKLMLNCL